MAIRTKLYRYKSEIGEEEFRLSNVLSFTDDDGHPAILIKNASNKTTLVKGKTDNLEYHLNSVISKNGSDFYYHVIVCLKNDVYSKEQFDIAFKYLFDKIISPQKDNELSSLINSLESLFKVSKESDLTSLRIGVFGELLFVDRMYHQGFTEILDKYHSNFYSKHDIEVDSKTRIEIKTTRRSPRIHTFKHDQLVRPDISVFVGSLIIEPSEEGMTLFELFERIESYLCSPEQVLVFGQLKSFCKISIEDQGPSFAFDRAVSFIKVFAGNSLPHLDVPDGNGISNVTYDVDCSMAKDIPLPEFVRILKGANE